MSFKIGKKTIKCNVEFKAEGDLDEMIDVSIVLVYQRPSVKEARQFGAMNAKLADLANAMGDTERKSTITEGSTALGELEQEMSDFVRSRITGWDQVFDDDGEALEFNAENLELLFGDRDARRGAFSRYMELVTGRKVGAEENLKKSPDTGLEPAESPQ